MASRLTLLLSGRKRYCFFIFSHQVDDGLIEAVAHAESITSTGNVSYDDVDSGRSWTHIDGGLGAEVAKVVRAGSTLPFSDGKLAEFFGFLLNGGVDGLNDLITARAGWNVDANFVPEPLAGCREVKSTGLV